MTFLKILIVTTPSSDYLETKDLDFVQAWRQISSVASELKTLRNEIHTVVAVRNTFVGFTNNLLADKETDIDIQTGFPGKKLRNCRAELA